MLGSGRVKQVWHAANLMQIRDPKLILSENRSTVIFQRNNEDFRLSYVSFDTEIRFLVSKARLPESPALTNTFTKLPRLAGIFHTLYTFLPLGCIEGLGFVSLLLIYLVNGGLTATRLLWVCSPQSGSRRARGTCSWTRSASRSASTAFWALAWRTETRSWKSLMFRDPVRRDWPRDPQGIRRLTDASVLTVERSFTVRHAFFPLCNPKINISRLSSRLLAGDARSLRKNTSISQKCLSKNVLHDRNTLL